ncbi:MAG: hypothetical protein ACRD0P_33780, partial [Stackebrandtia sp.]
MRVDGSGGALSYPAEKASLEELYQAVLMDRPGSVDQQAEDWHKLHSSLKVVVAAIDLHVSKVSGSSESQGSQAYLGQLREQRDRFDQASTAAFSNASNVENVSAAMKNAGVTIGAQYAAWQKARKAAADGGADETKLKEIDKKFDEQAQYSMWSIARDAKTSADLVQPPTESSRDHYGNDQGGGPPPGGGSPSGGPAGSGPATPSGGTPSTVPGGTAGPPQLQTPGPVPTTPAPAPPVPAPPTAG